ncbi:MAG: corrinoid activation/regeneration protein AcsV [Lachnospiraceae bacterium]|nr:corrinoid activation/regeneration protein AcsV [Lachnospiraceae bacterium]MDY3730753.1 corrinoid activation/regeneration protein AcsV [Candidatus Choladocola sp.]
MYKVTFKFESGEDVVAYAALNENLLEVARKTNVAIDAPCSGNAACGKCKVKLVGGELESKKTMHITDEEYAQGWRLSCVSKVIADVEVLVPDIASAYRSRMKVADLSSAEELHIFEKVKADIAEAGITFKNDLEVISVVMEEPSLDNTMPDNERLMWALEDACGVSKVKMPFTVLKKMAEVLRKSSFQVQCVIRRGEDKVEVLDILPTGVEANVYGLAVDIGTTTVSALIINMLDGTILAKASAGNGQIRYGADVINRIIEQQKEGGRKKLQDAIIKETLNPLIHEMCRSAKISTQHIYRMCVASNTTMNHLFAGVDADPVRMEPFIPTFFETDSMYAQDLGIHIYPHARIIIAPNIGSYVGGDITAGTFASTIWNKEEMSLFIDLGTNGELVFGNSEFMMSCACSAGPAFEGGDISCGMRATDGAIEACTIDKDTMEPTYKIVGDEGQKPVGICGSGIIDIISELFRCGIISPKGKFIREGNRVRHDEYGMGSFVIAFKDEAASVKDIELTEVDIDNFIRAKGAIFSAIRVMLQSLDFDVSMIDRIYVAGGIGSGINMKNAVNIGMFPDVELDKFTYIGNSSLSGAYAMLYSTEAEEKVADVAHNMTYLELSNEPTYMDEFVACCFLPHTDATLFPSLEMK